MIKLTYVISIILLFILSILVKKKEEKIDIITTFFVGVILISCYNVLICLILKLLTINANLCNLGIINYIISTILIFKIVKEKQIQKYFIIKKDILIISFIIVVGLIVSYAVFGFPFNIGYMQVDASNHYGMATEFYKTGNIELASIPGAYINIGIVFKIFFESINTFDGYKIFIVCEIIKLILSGILFYITIKKFSKTKVTDVIITVLSLLYMLSYPLNGMLSGFVYLQMAVNIVNTILIIIVYYNEIDNTRKNIVLFLLSFGLMFTYYILVPPIYIALFLYELRNFKKEKLRCVKNIISIFLIPCIAGLMFFILPGLMNPESNFMPTSNMASSSAYEGYIYVSYYSMFLFFIPFNIYYFIKKSGEKEINALNIILFINVLYVIFAVILKKYGIIARYYCMKPYYMLWLIMLTITGISICELLEDKTKKLYKTLTTIVFFAYILCVIYTSLLGPCSFKIFEQEKESVKSMFNMYRLNRGLALHETFEIIYTNKELETLKDITKDFNENTNIIYIEDGLNKEWLRRLLLINDNNFEKYKTTTDVKKEGIQNLIHTEDEIYIICYENIFIRKYYTEILNDIKDNFNLVAKEGKLSIYTNKQMEE